nr:hypothetical protein Iba_chr09aCG2270 [Ipomoea batatas]
MELDSSSSPPLSASDSYRDSSFQCRNSLCVFFDSSVGIQFQIPCIKFIRRVAQELTLPCRFRNEDIASFFGICLLVFHYGNSRPDIHGSILAGLDACLV